MVPASAKRASGSPSRPPPAYPAPADIVHPATAPNPPDCYPLPASQCAVPLLCRKPLRCSIQSCWYTAASCPGSPRLVPDVRPPKCCFPPRRSPSRSMKCCPNQSRKPPTRRHLASTPSPPESVLHRSTPKPGHSRLAALHPAPGRSMPLVTILCKPRTLCSSPAIWRCPLVFRIPAKSLSPAMLSYPSRRPYCHPGSTPLPFFHPARPSPVQVVIPPAPSLSPFSGSDRLPKHCPNPSSPHTPAFHLSQHRCSMAAREPQSSPLRHSSRHR